MTRNSEKPVWAVDVSQCDTEMKERVAHGLRAYFGDVIPPIQPVYVLSPDATSMPSTWFRKLLPKLREDAGENLRRALADCPFPVTEPHVLAESPLSSVDAEEILCAHARTIGADLIVVPTEGKTGLTRLVLGSFAESLLLHATMPVLTINRSNNHRVGEPRRCLVPVDYAQEPAPEAFDEVIAAAKSHGAAIIFFHLLPPDLKSAHWSQTIFNSTRVLIASLRDEEVEVRRAMAQALVTRARDAGCQAESVFSEASLSAQQAIVDAATVHGTHFIAMLSYSAHKRINLSGSVARAVARAATCPVWIFAGATPH